VAALWGVGDKTGEVLARFGLRTVGDIARTPVATLQRELGTAAGAHLAALAWGRDPRPVMSRVPDKSIGAEETFAADVDDPVLIRRELLRLAAGTAARCVAGEAVGGEAAPAQLQDDPPAQAAPGAARRAQADLPPGVRVVRRAGARSASPAAPGRGAGARADPRRCDRDPARL